MDSIKFPRTVLGVRPPPGRTYGSKQGSKRASEQSYQRQQSKSSLLRTPQGSIHKEEHPESVVGRSLRKSVDGLHGSGLLQATKYDGRRLRSSSIGEMEQLLRSVGKGGEGGRAAAIALAQTCKYRETRNAMCANGGTVILDRLVSTLQASLESDGGRWWDEAIVHCLAVALFILSKDAPLAKAFPAKIIPTLASLIESSKLRIDEAKGRHSSRVCVGARGLESTASSTREIDWRVKSTSTYKTNTPSLGKRRQRTNATTTRSSPPPPPPPAQRRAQHSRYERMVASVFNMGDEDESGRVGSDASTGGATSDGRDSNETRPLGDAPEKVASPWHLSAPDRDSASVMVRARMLLDITDVLPWGLANRHLVSAADLGLTTLLNVAAQACRDGAEMGTTGDGEDPENSLEEDFSTQGSVTASHSDQGSVLTDGITDFESPSANESMMLELSRLGPCFLLPLVVSGGSVLEALSTSRVGEFTGVGTQAGAAVDPALLRSVHQLLLTLRLLDMATLENPSDAWGSSEEGGGRSAELGGALIGVVSRCLRANRRSRDKAVATGLGTGSRHQQPMRQNQPFADDAAARVHECLLAALRVLSSVTHDDARVCAEVAREDGLETLMLCLVAHSSEIRRNGESGDDDHSPLTRLESTDPDAFMGDTADGVPPLEPGGRPEDANDTGGRRNGGVGDFDAQVLAMSALINCVELKESADNCAAMATLAVRPPAKRKINAGGEKQQSSTGAFPMCFAPEFLAKALVHYTRSFARHLEANRADEGEGKPALAQQPREGQCRKVMDKGEETSTTASVLVNPSEPELRPVVLEMEEEESMSDAEGSDLVLAGHCALLLGLLVREHKDNRYLALSALPDRDAMLIVRTLEAFMALQYQAGVLTEELVLKVQLLVEDLEGMELPEEDHDPFKLDSEEDELMSNFSTTIGSLPKARKKQRSSANNNKKMPLVRAFPTPPSVRWTLAADGDEDTCGFSLTESCPGPRGRLLPQDDENGSSCPSDHETAPCKPPPHSFTPLPSLTEESTARSPEDRSKKVDTPSGNSGILGSTGTGWRFGKAAEGLRELSGGSRGGGSATGARKWLSGSQTRTYGRQSTYQQRSWSKPARSLAAFRSSLYGKLNTVPGKPEQPSGPASGKNAFDFDILSETSDDALQETERESGGGGGSGADKAVGRKYSGTRTLTRSGFEIACSSDDSPVRPRTGVCSNRTVKCALSNSKGGGSSQTNLHALGQARPYERQQCAPSPPPAKAAETCSPSRGVGPRSGGDLLGQRGVQAARAVASIAPGQAPVGGVGRGVVSPAGAGTLDSAGCDWRSSIGPLRPASSESSCKQGIQGAEKSSSVSGRAGSRGRVAGQADASSGINNGSGKSWHVSGAKDPESNEVQRAPGPSSKNVFEFGEESD